MKSIDFKRPEIEDREILLPYFDYNISRNCERSYTNLLLWSRIFKVTWAIVNDVLVMKSENFGLAFSYPLGEDEKVKAVIPILKEYSESRGFPLVLYNLSPIEFEKLDGWYPNTFQIEYNRDYADYIYESEKLSSLAGKKLHGKRNHINNFKKNFEDRWSYETMSEDNLEECFQMALKWRSENGCDEDDEKNNEMCVTLNSLRLFRELELVGGLLKIDGEVVAFTIGERLSEDTFVVHIEKAFAEIQGCYPMINQQFVSHECMQYRYINREEDTGELGLRKAKLSYRPVFLEEKGIVKEIEK